MPTPPLNPILPTGQVSASRLRAIAQTTEQLARPSTSGGLTYRQDAAGVRVTDERPETILGRITGQVGGALYSFTQVYDQGDGTFPAWPDGIAATAWEVTGNAKVPLVPTSPVVELTLNPAQTGYSFAYCCTT